MGIKKDLKKALMDAVLVEKTKPTAKARKACAAKAAQALP
jgi:hypothetical protein